MAIAFRPAERGAENRQRIRACAERQASLVRLRYNREITTESAQLGAPPTPPDFKPGDHVVYRPHGIGRIVGTQSHGAYGDPRPCFLIDVASGMRVLIPVENAADSLRPLSTPEEARRDLEALRQEGIEPDTEKRPYKAKADARARIMKHGTREEIAMHLRQLYARRTPVSESEGNSIRAFEGVVLTEIALVLQIPRGELEHEMRIRYPAPFKRSSKGTR